MNAFASWMNRFKAKKPDPSVVAAIKAWVLDHLGTPEGTTLAVNEIDCNDPACPGVETIILIMPQGGRTRACKIPKRIEDVTPEDIPAALAAGLSPEQPAS